MKSLGWIYISTLLRFCKNELRSILFLSTLIFTFGSMTPIFTKNLLDNTNSNSLLFIYAILSFISVSLECIFNKYRSLKVAGIAAVFDLKMSRKAYALLISGRYQNQSKDDERILFQKIAEIRNFLLIIFPQMLFGLGQAFISIIIITYYSPIIASAMLVLSLLTGFILRRNLMEFEIKSLGLFDAESANQADISETISGLREIKTQAIEIQRLFGSQAHVRKVAEADFSLAKITASFSFISQFSTGIILIMALAYGVWSIQHGFMTIGEVFAIQYLGLRVIGPIVSSGDLIVQFQQANVAVNVLSKMLSNFRREIGPPPPWLQDDCLSIAVDVKEFYYTGSTFPALSSIQTTINGPGTVAIVGRNGSGKSTLLDALIGFVHAETLSVIYNGQEIADCNHRKFRSAIGVVRQDSELFRGTIVQNITGSPDIFDSVRLNAALDFAGASNFVRALESAEFSQIDLHGVNLSGGQRQRLSLARAFYRDPPIVILDEPTSFLDSETAIELERRVLEWGATKLVLLVTHNLFALQNSIRILVLDQGKIVGDGFHADLLLDCQAYKDLWTAQIRQSQPSV